jgi:signal transduction histidine kinase
MRQTVRRTEPERGAVELNEAVQVVARLLDWKARRANVAVHLNLANSLPNTYGDRVQIEQVIFNLLQNAIEAVVARDNGPRTVEIETSTCGEIACVVVRDTGIGLLDSERVFERFYTTKPDGMGLGLAISRSIAEAHGGKLFARAIEGGAEFTLELPVYQEEKP